MHRLRYSTMLWPCIGFILLAMQPAQRPLVIKLGTLAPAGSPWHKALEDLDAEWREISGGDIRLRIYPGGVLGDENDLVRKMRLTQIQAVALSAKGLSEIDPGIWGLSQPMLADNIEDFNWIRSRVKPELERRYQDAGLQILLWADVGWVRWFSTSPIRTPDDLKEHRIFTWAGSSHLEYLFKTYDLRAVSLSVLDVTFGLETGLIDAIALVPLTAASAQWFGIANYMTKFRWSLLTGALLIRTDVWNLIPPDQQVKLLESAHAIGERLQKQAFEMDAEAIRIMEEYGLQVVEITPEERLSWAEWFEPTRLVLRGTLVDTTMFDRIKELRRERSKLDSLKE